MLQTSGLAPPGGVTSPSFRSLLYSGVGWVGGIAQRINKRLVQLGQQTSQIE